MTDYRTKAERDAAERFPRETAGHQMTVLHDDGLYRHLRFARPKPASSMYWFDLVTWPGSLTIRGDIGESYTFSRLPDMFEFFRAKPGRINPHYWAEKLDAGRSSVKEYDQDIFEARVKEYVVEAIRDGSTPRGIGKAVREEILDDEHLADEHEARKLLDSFEFKVGYLTKCSCGQAEDVASDTDGVLWGLRHKRSSAGHHEVTTRRSEGFTFYDTWEWSFSDYSWEFLWACHAIVWGIARYDKVARYGLKALATIGVLQGLTLGTSQAGEATAGGQFGGDDWVSCSHRACPRGEYRAKAAERGWHQGPMDAWLCTEHAGGGQ